MGGCVRFSGRFYEETLHDPATSSPLIFPETVFNAPASHLGAILGASAFNYTFVGDPGTFLVGLATGANWVLEGQVDGAIVIGAEESDWLLCDAFRRFERKAHLSEGAGALYLRRGTDIKAARRVRIEVVTDAHSYLPGCGRGEAARRMRAQLPEGTLDHLLVLGTQNLKKLDAAELNAWSGWPGPQLAPKLVLGEGLAASSAWQCVAAADAISQGRHSTALVSVVGCNQQAIGAQFSLD
jgi:hypothetical protein